MAMKIFLFFLVVAMVVFLLLSVFSMGGLLDYSFLDKGSPFECGFNSFSMFGVPFSMSFFSISLIFIVFDVEILLLCFFPFSFVFSYFTSFYLSGVVFIVMLATLYEWGKGLLSWF